jgi:hypothetical protein
MNRTKLKYILLGFVCFGFAILIVSLLKHFKLTDFDWILSLLGLALFVLSLFYLFKSRKPLMFFISGMILLLVSYLIFSLLSRRYSDLPEIYTVLAAIILPILALLSFIATLLGAIYIFREIFGKDR